MYYVVQVKTGKEEKTIDAIKKQLGNDIDSFDVFAPYKVSIRSHKGVRKEVIERCFPGYVFVETDYPKDLFFHLFWVPEFTKLLGREGLTYNFVPLNDDESRVIDILYSRNSNRTIEISDIVVHEGQIVRVVTGPLEGLLGNIKKVNLHKRTVIIEYALCGRLVTSALPINIITDLVD
jgi:transcriptional antiterminator NusG